jgi:hypothetical protein
MVESRLKRVDPRPLGFDASVGFRSDAYARLTAPLDAYRTNTVLDYGAAVEAALHRPADPWKRFPGVMVGWDNTARRKGGATIFSGSTPEAYERWLRGTVAAVAEVRDEENFVFVAAWNEWAEGNHLEPDRHYGRAYLEATGRALEGVDPSDGLIGATDADPVAPAPPPLGGAPEPDSPAGHASRLVREATVEHRRVVELDLEPERSAALMGTGIAYESIAVEPGNGWVESLLDRLGTEPATLLLRGVLERVPDPHVLLFTLSEWARTNGSSAMVISVANVGHVGNGLLLLTGRWDPTDEGEVGRPVVRHFTRSILERLVERCGWTVVGADDTHSSLSARDATEDAIPEVMVGALHAMAESSNPDWSVEEFVWVLEPIVVDQPPRSYSAAVDGSVAADVGEPSALTRYFSSIGLLSGVVQIRADEQLRRTHSRQIRHSIQRAVVELAFPDRWADDLPLLSDVVDELVEFYLARNDLVDAFGAEESFDAMGYVQWAIADHPMVAASVDRLGDQFRDSGAAAIRTALAVSDADRDTQNRAAEVLADLYFHRWDLRSAMGNGRHFDVAQLLHWAMAASQSDDPAAAGLAPYRSVIESALATTRGPGVA